MERHVRYHEIKSTTGALLRTALFAGERILTRLLEGRPEPTPKAIRDLGKTARQAHDVQLVTDGLIERTHIAFNRWDDMGDYHDDHIRLERTDLGQVDFDRNWDVT